MSLDFRRFGVRVLGLQCGLQGFWALYNYRDTVDTSLMIAKIAASFNYCLLGAAPTYLDAAELRPENVEAHESMIPEPKTTFPRSFLAEVRADWKFMKASWQ